MKTFTARDLNEKRQEIRTVELKALMVPYEDIKGKHGSWDDVAKAGRLMQEAAITFKKDEQ